MRLPKAHPTSYYYNYSELYYFQQRVEFVPISANVKCILHIINILIIDT